MDKGTRVDKILQGAILVRERDLWGHGDGNGTLKKIQWSGIYFSSSTDIPYVSINSIKFLFFEKDEDGYGDRHNMQRRNAHSVSNVATLGGTAVNWSKWNSTYEFFLFFFNIKTQIVIETD